MRNQIAIGLAAVLVGVAATASAQTDSPLDSTGDKCRAEQPSDDETQPAPAEKGDPSLTETLDECEGLLKPPRTGDREIAEPPPDEGKTPVIPPGALPPQQDGG